MDGTESLRPIYYQLHTAGRRLHSNVGARRSQKNTTLGPESCVLGLSAMLPSVAMDIFVRIGVGKLQFTSGGAIAGWRSRFQFNQRHVRFWIESGHLVTANRLIPTEIGID
jgi:hypothetical protein